MPMGGGFNPQTPLVYATDAFHQGFQTLKINITVKLLTRSLWWVPRVVKVLMLPSLRVESPRLVSVLPVIHFRITTTTIFQRFIKKRLLKTTEHSTFRLFRLLPPILCT